MSIKYNTKQRVLSCAKAGTKFPNKLNKFRLKTSSDTHFDHPELIAQGKFNYSCLKMNMNSQQKKKHSLFFAQPKNPTIQASIHRNSKLKLYKDMYPPEIYHNTKDRKEYFGAVVEFFMKSHKNPEMHLDEGDGQCVFGKRKNGNKMCRYAQYKHVARERRNNVDTESFDQLLRRNNEGRYDDAGRKTETKRNYTLRSTQNMYTCPGPLTPPTPLTPLTPQTPQICTKSKQLNLPTIMESRNFNNGSIQNSKQITKKVIRSFTEYTDHYDDSEYYGGHKQSGDHSQKQFSMAAVDEKFIRPIKKVQVTPQISLSLHTIGLLFHVYGMDVQKSQGHMLYEFFKQSYPKALVYSKANIKVLRSSQASENMYNILEKLAILGIPELWHRIPQQISQLIGLTSTQHAYFSPSLKSMRRELFVFKFHETKISSSFEAEDVDGKVVNIFPTQRYHSLFDNNCEELRDLVRCLVNQLMKIKGKALCLQLSLDNLFYFDEKDYRIGDWGNSAICTEVTVDDGVQLRTTRTCDRPFIFNENQKEWLVYPDYLPPEFVRSYLSDDFTAMAGLQYCPEVWSIGLMIYELLTHVPLWMPFRSTAQLSRGLFWQKNRNLSTISSKHAKIGLCLNKLIREHKSSQLYSKVDVKMLRLVKDMLNVDWKLRPSLEKILQEIK